MSMAPFGRVMPTPIYSDPREQAATVSVDAELLRAAAKSLRECAEDLESELVARYGPDGPPRPPSEERRFQRDIEPANKAFQCAKRLEALVYEGAG